MKELRRHAVKPQRGRRIAVVSLGVAAVVAVVAGAVGLATVAARRIVVPTRARKEDIAIVAVDIDAGTIILRRTPDSIVDGRYSLWFSRASGHARIGEILAETTDTVTRELLGVDSGDLARARKGRLAGWFYLSPADVDVPFESVLLRTELGDAPAWLVATEDDSDLSRWVIHVHGRAVTRAETIRAVPVFRAAGYTSLLVSYRNDGEAPSSGDGRYALGDTEWRDVDAALSFAIERGASKVVLMGWSMGGAIVLQALTRSDRATYVRGLVLESPVVDWVAALDHQAKTSHIILPLRFLAYEMISTAWGRLFTGQAQPIDLDRLDFVERSRELSVPILILHSDNDDYVPPGASRALAAARPDLVTLESFATARHTRLWNREPDRWTDAISRWLTALDGSD